MNLSKLIRTVAILLSIARRKSFKDALMDMSPTLLTDAEILLLKAAQEGIGDWETGYKQLGPFSGGWYRVCWRSDSQLAQE